MAPTPPSSPPPLRHEVHAQLGKSCLVYLAIESTLKLYLPYVRGSEKELLKVDTINWRELLDTKAPLGSLVKLLLERIHVEPRESFENQLKLLVENRNQFIHHFNELPFAPLATDAECEAALKYLSVRKEFAIKWFEVFKNLAERVLGGQRQAQGER